MSPLHSPGIVFNDSLTLFLRNCSHSFFKASFSSGTVRGLFSCTPHTSNDSLAWLQQRFPGWLSVPGATQSGPPHSPDINPPDFFSVGLPEGQSVWEQPPDHSWAKGSHTRSCESNSEGIMWNYHWKLCLVSARGSFRACSVIHCQINSFYVKGLKLWEYVDQYLDIIW